MSVPNSILPEVRTSSLSDVVYGHILSEIVDGVLPIHGRLQSESEIARRFGVSRPIVRDAFARLRDDGLIVSRKGSGSYVVARPAQSVRSLAPLSSISDMQRCFEFRVAIEGEAAHQAALSYTEDDVLQLNRSFDVLDTVVQTGTLGTVEDFGFHLAVCRATHNRFFVEVMEHLRENIVLGINLTRNLSLRRPAQRIALVQAEHRDILSRILKRDSSGAREAMRVHIENARRRVFEGVERDTL